MQHRPFRFPVGRASIVAVTDSVFSPIASPADALIEVSEANFEGFRSMATTMAIATHCESGSQRLMPKVMSWGRM